MAHPHLKTLENHAAAAGCAFGFAESDFEARYVPPARPGRVAMMLLAVAGAGAALAHHFGWTTLMARLGGWGQAA
ncbi:MAG: hypothetical protein O9342_04105 [Beijerinckiaceae bacterium]|nr:hypothetical protein [Beijerinckiaceae bacterium]